MGKILLFFLSISLTQTFAVNITAIPLSLRSSTDLASKKTKFEECNRDECTPIGPKEGYLKEEWDAIQKICKDEGYYGEAQQVVFIGLVTIPMTVVAPAGVATVGAILHGASSEAVPKEALVQVGETLHVIFTDSKFDLRSRKIIHFVDATELCIQKFEWFRGKTYRRYINGWGRPLG